jgi:hypothetical protein
VGVTKELHIVCGLFFTLIAATWFSFLNLPANPYFICFILIIAVLGGLNAVSVKKASLSMMNIDYRGAQSWIMRVLPKWAIVLFLFIQMNGSWNLSRIAARYGPDIYGWIASANLFCSNQTVADLESRISYILPLSTHDDLFGTPTSALEKNKHLYSLPSFTDQISAEFLIGAGRPSIPYLLGSVCQVNWGPSYIYSYIVAFAVILALVQFDIVRNLLLAYGVKAIFATCVATSLTLSYAVLAPLFEGGLGQYFAHTGLLVLLNAVARFQGRIRTSVVVLATIALTLAYVDSTFFILPFLFVFSLFVRKTFHISKLPLLKILRSLPLVVVVSLACIPGLGNLLRNAIYRLSSEHRGGWFQGRIPLPADLIGFYNWLPGDSFSKTNFSLIAILMNLIIISLLLIVSIDRQVSSLLKALTITFLALSIYLSFDVLYLDTHLRGFQDINNYSLFKFGMFGSALSIPVYIWLLNSSSDGVTGGYLNQWGDHIKHFVCIKKIIAIFLLASSMFASATYHFSWFQSRSFPVDNRYHTPALEKVFEGYDFVVFGASSVEKTAAATLGDLRYAGPSRGFDVPAKRSSPQRPLALICMSNSKSCFSGASIAVGTNHYLLGDKINTTVEISIYEISKDFSVDK